MAEVVANNTQKEKTNATVERGSREFGPQPLALGPEAGLLALQASAGNRAVSSLLGSMSSGVLVQRKCTSCGQAASKCSGCREEEHLQRKTLGGNGSAAAAKTGVPALVQQALDSRGGRSLEPAVRSMMESRFNHDFRGVRVHHDAMANRAAASINAAAFTVGNSIWFGEGQYQTGTRRGLHLLAHELAHTVQQRGHAGPLQGRLTIGAVHDSAEAAADRAADAVLTNGRVPSLSMGSAVIRRQQQSTPPPPTTVTPPQVTDASDLNDIEVQFQGDTYRVRRRATRLVRECQKVPANEAPSLSADFDSSDAWAQVDWCTTGGATTRGTVRFGADVPAALQRTIRDLVNGGRDPRTVLNGFEITPFVEVEIARSGPVQVTGRIDLTVRPSTPEVRGGRGSIEAQTRIGTFGFELSGSAPETPGAQPDVRGVFTFDPFRRPAEPVPCRTKEVCTYKPDYEFRCIQRIPPRPNRLPDETRYLYFEYATDVIATRDSATGRNRRAENNRGAERNETEIPRIQQLFDDGWMVSSIRGFTSPEGPREGPSQPPRRGESQFIGNTALSQNRADAARTKIETLCNPLGMLAMRPRRCFDGTVTPTGEGELLTANTASGREMEGTPLATQAATRFPTEESSQSTPAIQQQLGRAGPSQRGSLIYPYLRRATITFTKTVTIPGRDTAPGACLPEVEEAVRTFFREREQRRQRRQR